MSGNKVARHFSPLASRGTAGKKGPKKQFPQGVFSRLDPSRILQVLQWFPLPHLSSLRQCMCVRDALWIDSRAQVPTLRASWPEAHFEKKKPHSVVRAPVSQLMLIVFYSILTFFRIVLNGQERDSKVRWEVTLLYILCRLINAENFLVCAG